MYNKKKRVRGDGDIPLLKDDYKKNEKLNGIIYDMSPSGGFAHGQINGNIYHALRSQLKDSVCAVSIENLDLYLSDDEYVIPDVMLICDRNQIKKDKYRGIPRFITETLSPSTAFKDRTVKMEAYANLGVDEYWIIMPKDKSVERYYLNEGRYVLTASYILEEDKESKAYNAEIVLTLRAMPNVSMTLEEIFAGL